MKKLLTFLFVLSAIFSVNLFVTDKALAQTSINPVEKLKLISPTAKTVWQQGNSHTISWSPNSDNPNIEAFFETKKGNKFKTYAKLLPCAKGSIIWCGTVDETPNNGVENWSDTKTGSYFVSIVDKVTGQRARTRSPIKIVGEGEVIKLNASALDENNGLIKAEYGQLTYINLAERKITLNWKSQGDSCVVEINGDTELEKYEVKKNGTRTFDLPGNYDGYSVIVTCRKGSNATGLQFSVNMNDVVQQNLTILDVTYRPSSPVVNEWITTDVTIKNNTTKQISGSRVNVQGTLGEIPTLNPGEKTVVTVENAFSYSVPGTHELNTVIIGSDNNSYHVFTNTLTFGEQGSSIKVLSPNGGEQLISGNTTTINVVTNLTDKQTKGITLQLYRYVDGKDFPYMYVQDIEKEWIQGFPYAWRVPEVESGQYVIYAGADVIGSSKDGIYDFGDRPFTITNSSNSSCPAFTRDLTVGSVGDDVSYLQYFLQQRGFLVTSGEDKGYFGAMTKVALAKYQASVGISPADGYFGSMTRAIIAANCGTVVEPYIKILSPNGGERYTAGDSIVINWETNLPKDQNLTFAIQLANHDIGKEITTVKAGDKSYTWKSEYIDSILMTESIPAQTIYSNGNFKIWLYCPHTDAICIGKNESNYVDTSDNPFIIQKVATSTPLRQPRPRVVPPATPSANTSMTSIIDLELGMAHPSVITLQKFLNSNGYVIETKAGQPGSKGYESDYFGEKTKQALMKYQKDKKIYPVWGFYGPQTRRVMGI